MNNILSIDPGLNNCGIVGLNIDNDDKIRINYCDLVDFKEGLKKSSKFEDVINNIIIKLNGYNNINLVLIENPPSLKNPQLKSIAIVIYTYFKLKGIKTVLVSPSKKLSKEENKTSYKERKKFGIEKCFNLLSDVDKNEINKLTKKDDCCDAIIQAYEYVKKNIIKPIKIKIPKIDLVENLE